VIFSVAALVAAQLLSPISRECLGCHDGSVAVDIVLDQSHPVSVLYPTTGAKYRWPIALPLYDSRVECRTCHGVDVSTMHFGTRRNTCVECHRV